MLSIVLRRALVSIPLVVVVTLLTFVLAALAPGDVAQVILGAGGTQEQLAELRAQLGLDLPVLTQYWNWFLAAAQGNLGTSLLTGESVSQMLSTRLPVTVSIVLGVLLMTLVVGVGLGILGAQLPGRLRSVIDGMSTVGLMFPSFVVSLLLVLAFAVQVRWLPTGGYTPFGDDPGTWAAHLVLPILGVALMPITAVAKQTSEAMESALNSGYVLTLKASGVPQWRVVLLHALRNSSGQILTVVGLMMISAVSNAVFIEKIFVLPGLGGLAADAAAQQNLPVLQGVAVVFTLLTILINLAVDLAHGAADPRVRNAQ